MSRPSFQYGGQAVIEGVMMRGPSSLAVAVRQPAGNIVVEREELKPVNQRHPAWRWPVVRGVLSLVESLVLGIRTLTFSATAAMGEEEGGEELSTWELAATVGLAVLLAVALFVVAPTAAAHWLQDYMNVFWQNLLEGLVRLALFLLYVVAISRLPDIRRVFEYHGAEHKVIHTLEAGEELTVENARKHSTLHPRCGTAFLLTVMVLAIVAFSFLSPPGILARLLSRLLFFPLVAGVGYELIKLSARHTSAFLVRLLIAPGLWLQKLTTREPDEGQLEVAIRALREVLPPEQDLAPVA